MQAQDLVAEPFVVCLPSGHALARRGSLALVELAGEDFVFFARAASPSYYETVLSLCVTAGFTPLVRHEVRHWLSVAALVSQGLGWRSCRPACRAAGWPARASSASSTRRARSVRRSGRPGPHAVAGKRDAAGDGAHADVAA